MAKQEYLQDLVIKLEPISSEKLEEVLLREKRNALKFCTLSGVTIKDEPDEQIPSYSFPRDFEGFEDESELIFYSLGSDTQQVYNELFVDDVQPIDLKYIKAPIIQSTKLKTEDIPSKCVGYSITDEAFIKVEEEDLLIGNDLSSDSLPKTRLQASRLPKAQTISSGNTHDESATKATGDRETGHRRKKYGRLSSRPFAKSCTRKNAAKVSRKNKIDDIENNLGKPNRREQSASFQSRQDKGAAGVNNNVVHYKSKDISIISVQSTEPKSSLDDDIIASQNGVSFKRIMDTPLQKKNTSSDLQAKVSLKSSGDFSLDGISLQHIVELSSTIPSLAKEISFKPLPTNFQPPEINTSCSRKPEQTASPMQLPDIIDIHLEDNNAKKMACAVTVNPIKPNPMPLERTKRSVEINSDLFGNGNYMDLGNDVNMQNISDKNRQNLEFLQNSSHTKLYSEHSYVKQQPRLQPKVPQICNYERSNNVGENEFSDHLEHNYRSLIKSSLYEKKSAPLNSSHVSKISALDSVALVPLGRACETMSNAALLRAVRPSLAKQSKIGERENKELLENESVNSQIYLGSKGLPTKSALRQNENGEHCSKRILTDSGNESLAKKAKGSCKRRDREVSSAEAHQTEADDDWEGSNSIYKDFESRIQTQNRNMHNLSHQSMQHYDRFLNEYSEKAKKQTDPSEGELEICPLCQFSSVKLEAFLLHCTMVHMNKEKYECTLCHFSSSAKFVFLSHIRIHLEILLQDLEKRRIDGYFYCDKCEFKCIDVRQLFLHHHYKIFWCLCGSVFHNRADYITHKCFPKPGKIRDVTNHENFQGIDFVLSHKCPHCQFRSMSRTGLMKHQLIHYKVSFHQCHICNFTCMTEFTMINHLAQVHNYEQNRAIEEVRKINKEYMCYICESMFECSDDLKNHIISHTYEFSQFRQNQAYDAICPISKNSSAGETLEGDTETTSDKDFIQKEMQRNLVSLTDANLWQIPKLVEDYMNDVGMLVEYDLAQRDTNEDPSNYLGNKESCLHESELNNIEVPLKISNGPAEEMKNLKLKTSTEEGQALILQNPQVVESQSNENESYYVVDINESEIVLCNMDAINSNYENEEHLGYKIIPNVENFQKENEITEHENVNAINGALQHPKDYLHEVEGEICLGNETVHHSEDDLRVQEISAKYKTLQDIDHLYKQKGESDTEVGETLLHQKDCLPEQEAESKSVHHTKDYISEENEGFGSENEPSRYHTGQLHKKGGEINTEIEKSCDGKDYLHECKVECYTESETKLHSQVYLKEQKDEIDAENETLQCHEHNLHLEKGEISAEIETLKDQKKYLHEQKGENDAENETLQHPKHYLQEEKGDSIEEIETLQDEKDLHEENGEIGDERETLPPPKHYLQEEKGDSNSEIETLQDQKDLCEENVEIGEERETLLPRKHYLQEEKGDSNVEIETLQDEKDLHEENGEIGDERETLPPPKHYLQEEKGDSNAEIETLQDEKVLREENVEIGDERETLPPPKHYLQEEKGDSNAEIETLQDEKDLREENGEIGDERETLPHPKHYLQEEKGDSNAVIETLQDEKDLCEENGEIGDERETLPPRKHYLHEEIDAENETVHLPINLCEQTSEICVENETLLHPKHYLTDQNPGIDAENETLQLSKDSYEQAGNIGAEKETLIQPFYLCKVDDENKIILYTDPENETASLQNKNGRVENLETSFYHR